MASFKDSVKLQLATLKAATTPPAGIANAKKASMARLNGMDPKQGVHAHLIAGRKDLTLLGVCVSEETVKNRVLLGSLARVAAVANIRGR